MLHKGAPDQIKTKSFLADSAHRLYPSATNIDAAVALEASEHKRKIAQLRHHFLTQTNVGVENTATLLNSPSSPTAFLPADSTKGNGLHFKFSEHCPSGLIFKSRSATDFTQLNSSAFRNVEPSFPPKNSPLAVSNNNAGVHSGHVLAEQKSFQRGEQTTIPAFMHSTHFIRNKNTRACRPEQNRITIKIGNHGLNSSSAKTVADDSSVYEPGCSIYTHSHHMNATPSRLLSSTETPLPRPTNNAQKSTFYQLPDSNIPNLDGVSFINSEEMYRLPCRQCLPSSSHYNSAFDNSADVLQKCHFSKRKGRKTTEVHQDYYRLSADLNSTDRAPWPWDFNFGPALTTAAKEEFRRLAEAKRSCSPWPVGHRGHPDLDTIHCLHGEHRRKSVPPTPCAFLPVAKDPTLGNSAQPSSCRLSSRAPPGPLYTENAHMNSRNLLCLTESLSANDFRQVDLSPFSSASSKNTSSSSSSSSICSPERSPQLLRRQERRTRSWQGRQQRHRSRQNIREQDRLLVDSLTRRIQPMLLEGRAAEVKTLLLHALAKPSTRERALRLIGYVSDALSSSWSVQPFGSPSATGVTAMGNAFSGLRLGSERPTTRQSFSSDARSDRWAFGTGSTTSIPTGVSASPSRGGPLDGGNRNNNNNNAHCCVNEGGSFYAVRLPPGGVLEPPPPPCPASPPPKPFPPPSPKTAVMPSEERLRQLEARTLQLCDYNPLLITDLVTELTLDCSTDVEIVRSFFVWVTSKDFQQVDYDPAAASDSFVGLLRNVKAGKVSANELFHELCRFAGIPCHFISGRSKGAGYRPGMTLSENSLFRNTWLAVYVAKSWRFINCNWAARYRCVGNIPDHASYAGQQSLPPPSVAAAAATTPLRPGGRNHLQSRLPSSPSSSPSAGGGGGGGGGGYDEFYFLTEPSEHIYEHFPDKRAWQLLAKPISEKKFIRLPVLKSAFFNTKLALKKPYSAKLLTKNGQVTVKLRMPKFVGISSSLENCADGSALRGLCLIEVLTQPADVVRVVCAPSQPGRYYLNVYVSSDWRRDDIRELACSFLIECSEFNFSRLVVMGRLPEVGFLGRTPAAQHFGVVACGATNGSGGGGTVNRPYILHTSMEPLKLPFAIASGLRICHQLKSFDRPSQQMTDCDNYALLQMRSHLLLSSTLRSPSHSSANAHYHIRLPANAFFYFTVYAAYELDSDADHLECVYRILIDARRPTLVNGGSGGAAAVAAFPRQTYWWVGCRLLEPTRFNLEAGRRHLFRLDAPPHRFTSIAVVINGEEWHFLEALSPRLPGRWSGKVSVGAVLGQLSIYGSLAATAGADGSSPVATGVAGRFGSSEDVAYVKLLDYALVHASSTKN